jgi:hypothetical protein
LRNFRIFQKTPKENIRQRGENSPNLVTLIGYLSPAIGASVNQDPESCLVPQLHDLARVADERVQDQERKRPLRRKATFIPHLCTTIFQLFCQD